MSPDVHPDCCGCCEAPAPATPETISNRPSLSAIRYRVGTYASFREAMIEALARDTTLREWTSRRDDDFGIALLDMWAYVGDILTFYQERIANEAFLATATLPESVLRIAALLDYRPAPGIAATTQLVFTLEPNKAVQLPKGLRVQSVPGQGQTPQTFETIETIAADAKLNALRAFPLPEFYNPLAAGSTGGTLLPGQNALLRSESLLIFDAFRAELKKRAGVAVRDDQAVLNWAPSIQVTGFQSFTTRINPYRRQLRLFGYNAPKSYLESRIRRNAVVWRKKNVGDQPLEPKDTYSLDARYDDLKAGTSLLFVQPNASDSAPDGFARFATVQEVRTKPEILGDPTIAVAPLTDTVSEVVLGIRFVGKPAAHLDGGNLHVFAIADDNALWHARWGATLEGKAAWQSLGGSIASQVVAANQDHRLEVFAIGTDGAVYHIWQTTTAGGTWSGWSGLGKPLPGVTALELSVGSNEDGRLEVFAAGSDGALHHICQRVANGVWSNWDSLGVPAADVKATAVAVQSNRDGRLEAFVIGSDHALYHISQKAANNGWSGWATLAGWIDMLALASTGDGLHVVARGSDQALYHIWQQAPPSSGWSSWTTLGLPHAGVKAAAVAVQGNKDGRLEAFVIGSDNALYHTSEQTPPNIGWSGWQPLASPDGIGVTSVGLALDSGNLLRVLAVGATGALWERWQAAASGVGGDLWVKRGLPMWHIDKRRQIVVYELDGAPFDFSNYRYPATIAGSAVYLKHSDLDVLKSKRTLLLDDKNAQPNVVTVIGTSPVDVDGDGQNDHLAVSFTPALSRSLDEATAMLFGNVALVTHGETIPNEVLGAGDASAAFQSFTLKKKPVTFVPKADAPSGAGSSLDLRVGGVQWQERRTLYGATRKDQVFQTAIDEEGTMTVLFGDGKTGARLPTGRDNVNATYRHGIGRAGNVSARSLTTLRDRPLGLKSASNPLAAGGGADQESLQQSRANAPNTVRTFERIVSQRDFEDAAREYANIAKARSTWEWLGGEMTLRLVVAGDDGALVGGVAMQNLRKYLDARRDPNRRLLLESYVRIPVVVDAVVSVDARYIASDVQAAALAALQGYFAFDRLDLGQSVHLSDVYAVLASVPGVVAADIRNFLFKHIAAMPDRDLQRRGVQSRVVGGTTVANAVQGHLLIRPEEVACLEDPALDINVRLGTVP